MIRRNTPPTAYGTRDFLTLLAEREAALGLAETAETADVAPVRPPEPEPEAQDTDAWGNRLTSPRGWYGQYTIESWRRDRRTVYVCGQPQQHTRYWQLDGRMEHGQGFICTACFTLEAGLYGRETR